MRVSMIGEVTGTKVSSLAGVEAVKWLAFALMLGDHLARYALPTLGAVPFVLGRLVFPLFALALGLGAGAARSDRSRHSLVFRLAVWGIVAQAAKQFAVPDTLELNVLFTFAAGVVIYHAVVLRVAVHWWLGALGALVASCACEYGPVGALLVAGALWYGRTRHPGVLAAVAVSVALIGIQNGTQFGLLALPVAWALLQWPIELPRIRRFFYGAYVAQWVVIGIAAWWLR